MYFPFTPLFLPGSAVVCNVQFSRFSVVLAKTLSLMIFKTGFLWVHEYKLSRDNTCLPVRLAFFLVLIYGFFMLFLSALFGRVAMFLRFLLSGAGFRG